MKIVKPLRFVCDKVRDNCIIRFKCWTQRGVTHLSVEDVVKLSELGKDEEH